MCSQAWGRREGGGGVGNAAWVWDGGSCCRGRALTTAFHSGGPILTLSAKTIPRPHSPSPTPFRSCPCALAAADLQSGPAKPLCHPPSPPLCGPLPVMSIASPAADPWEPRLSSGGRAIGVVGETPQHRCAPGAVLKENKKEKGFVTPSEPKVHEHALCFMVMGPSLTSKVGGWPQVAIVGWWLAVGGWWRLAAAGGWQLVPVGCP